MTTKRIEWDVERDTRELSTEELIAKYSGPRPSEEQVAEERERIAREELAFRCKRCGSRECGGACPERPMCVICHDFPAQWASEESMATLKTGRVVESRRDLYDLCDYCAGRGIKATGNYEPPLARCKR